MGEGGPSDAGTSTESSDQSGRNSPASAVCYQGEFASGAETSPDEPQPASDAANETIELAAPSTGDDESSARSDAPSVNDPPGESHRDDASVTYFSPVSGQDIPPPSLNTSAATGSIVEPSASNDGSISHLDLTSIVSSHSSSALHPNHHQSRPMPQHTVSSDSTASSSTIRPESPPRDTFKSNSIIQFAELAALQKTYPTFPNQSYAALQEHHHGTPHPPHLRSRSSNPSPYLSYIGTAKTQLEHAASTPSGSRTAGNSPSGSPGLFTPSGSPVRPRSIHDDPHGMYPHPRGTYSSPFLHYTQRHVPKETHVADIDVDPISGRKIINQYEIIDELGRGVHGKVKLGRVLPDGEYVAIKIVERYSKKKRLGKNTSHEDKIKKEIAILKKARHSNIVSLLEVIDDPQWKKVYIVLEFVELGEILWRAPGKEEIGLLEYRRYLRESHGLKENEATAAEERTILEEARQKREKARRRQLKRELRGRIATESSESWSFEHYGDESDVDDSNSDALSHTSSAPSGSHRGSAYLNGKVDALAIPPPRLHPPTVPEDTQTADFATITGLTEATEIVKQQSDSFPSVDELDTITATGLEGTMYGPYDDIARGRTPSTAGSVDSHLFEDPHHTHVPEHFKYVPLLTIDQARGCFRDTLLGLEYLHFQGVIHRDIKPANLLQTKDHRIKISDFGVSYLGRERGHVDPNESESEAPGIDEAVELAKTVGTPAFYAPELCQTDCDGPTPPVTQQIDVWALGVTLYCLIFGRVPFHDHNPFVLMNKIAVDQVHIPRQRLKAVERGSASRPSSRGRMFQSRDGPKRSPFELEYEPIEDDLYDLLRRLLIKDPRRRIKLTEVKHHPWVLGDIANPYAWLEETDPAKDSATRIQVSHQDVADAVAQLNIYERVLRKVGNALGLGRSSSTRARAKSSATDPNASSLSSAASSSSTISQDGRRASVKPDESISAALRATRDFEHPLAQSQTASPEYHERSHYFPNFLGPPSHSEHSDNEGDHRSESGRQPRPMMAERANSTNSGTNKTIRPKDITKSLGLGNLGMGNMTFPALPSTPKTLDSPGGSSLGGIFGGAGRIVRHFRSRDRSGTDRDMDGRDRSVDRRSMDRLTDTSDDPHAEPSLAISNTVASGLLKQPDLPQSQSSSAAASPISSRAASITSPDIPYHSHNGVSRQSSMSSASSARRRPITASKDRPEPISLSDPVAHHVLSAEPTEGFDRAREESFRRRMVEEQQQLDRPPSSYQSLPQGVLSQGACPPSPDDEIFYRRQQEEAAARPRSATYDPSVVQHITHFPPLPSNRLFTSSSSEDHFASGLSQSTSNPSIPSVVSADSSLMPDLDDGHVLDLAAEVKESSADPPSDSSTIYHRRGSQEKHKQPHPEDDEGYAGDVAVESGDDDSDSDDSFIEITRRKSRDRPQAVSRSESINVGELGRHRARRTKGPQKTGRSESNGTMKKIRSRSMSGEEEILRTTQSS